MAPVGSRVLLPACWGMHVHGVVQASVLVPKPCSGLGMHRHVQGAPPTQVQLYELGCWQWRWRRGYCSNPHRISSTSPRLGEILKNKNNFSERV